MSGGEKGRVEDRLEAEGQSWLVTLYQLAHSDTRWAKEQAWVTISAAFGLLGAILALYKYPFAHAALWPFVKLALAIGVLAAFHLVQLHSSAAESRKTSDSIKKLMRGVPSDLLPQRGADPDHLWYLGFHIALVAGGVIVTIVGLQWIQSAHCAG